jgi:hypothetical protein
MNNINNYLPKCKFCYSKTNDYKERVCHECRKKFRRIVKKELIIKCDKIKKSFPEESAIIKKFLDDELI